jgi:hypothetical protein
MSQPARRLHIIVFRVGAINLAILRTALDTELRQHDFEVGHRANVSCPHEETATTRGRGRWMHGIAD